MLEFLLQASKVCYISTGVNTSLTILLSTILEKSKIRLVDHQILEILLFFQNNRPTESKQTSQSLVPEQRSASSDDADADSHESEEQAHQQQLLNARKQLTNTLSQLAAHVDFSESLTTESEAFQLLWGWLSSAEAEMQICALLMAGNMAFGSERKTLELVEQRDIVPQLVHIMEHSSNGLVLRSALEVVQIFSQRPRTRLSFGQHGMLEAMSRSWQQSTDMQLRISALHHTRQLLHECLGNIYHMVQQRPQASTQSLFNPVMMIFREAEMADVRVQCGLVVVEIWHTFFAKSRGLAASVEDLDLSHSTMKGSERSILEVGNDPNGQLEFFDTQDPTFSLLRDALIKMCQVHSDIIKPFLAVINSENSSLATRTWLTLALMSTEPSCADVLYGTLIDGDGSDVFRAVLADQEKVKPKDASNARVLLYELKQRFVSAPQSFEYCCMLKTTGYGY